MAKEAFNVGDKLRNRSEFELGGKGKDRFGFIGNDEVDKAFAPARMT